MNNKIIIISSMILSCLMGHFSAGAQQVNNRTSNIKEQSYIGITGGFSPVFGNYAKADYENPKSGFAASGMNFGVTGVYFLKGHFGIKGLVSFNAFGFHGGQNLADGYKEAFDLDEATFTQKGNNQAFNILVGPCYSFPFAQRFHFDLGVLVGYTRAQLAGNEVLLEDESKIEQEKSVASAFGYQLEAGLRYDLGNHFGLGLSAGYFGAKPDFKIENQNRVNEAGRRLNDYHQSIQTVNFNLAVSYRL